MPWRPTRRRAVRASAHAKAKPRGRLIRRRRRGGERHDRSCQRSADDVVAELDDLVAIAVQWGHQTGAVEGDDQADVQNLVDLVHGFAEKPNSCQSPARQGRRLTAPDAARDPYVHTALPQTIDHLLRQAQDEIGYGDPLREIGLADDHTRLQSRGRTECWLVAVSRKRCFAPGLGRTGPRPPRGPGTRAPRARTPKCGGVAVGIGAMIMVEALRSKGARE